MDYADLQMVKRYAHALARQGHPQTVILRPGHTHYSIIPTECEGRVLKDALVVWRTNEHPEYA